MIDEALLEALGTGQWCSGAALGRSAGLSRAAVWKRIESLRRCGYVIEAQAGLGYRLVKGPDRLLAAEIQRHATLRRMGARIVHYEEVDSTNRVAAELAREGAPEGTAVVAEAQTAGRGRLGRSWSSPRGVNIYLSLILRPPVVPAEVTSLSLVAAVAVVEAIARDAELCAAIKWPNDVLVDGKKVAGILTEMEAETDQVRFLILGIGINVNAQTGHFPEELRDTASSLAIARGTEVDRVKFAGGLLERLEEVYGAFVTGGFAAVKERYEEHHCLRGRHIRVSGAGNPEGVVRGVATDGALLLETDQGLVRVSGGEVSLHGAYRS